MSSAQNKMSAALKAKKRTIDMTIGPIMPDGLPVDLKIDLKWLTKEMAKTGKKAEICISDHIVEGFHRDLIEANRISRLYAASYKG